MTFVPAWTRWSSSAVKKPSAMIVSYRAVPAMGSPLCRSTVPLRSFDSGGGAGGGDGGASAAFFLRPGDGGASGAGAFFLGARACSSSSLGTRQSSSWCMALDGEKTYFLKTR